MFDDISEQSADHAETARMQAEINLLTAETETCKIFISDGTAAAAASAPAPVRKRKRAAANGDKPPRQKRAPAAPKQGKLKRMQEAHRRKTAKATTDTVVAAFDLFSESTLQEARKEANDSQHRCEEALRFIRSNIRVTNNAPQVIRAHAQLVKKLRVSAPPSDEAADVLLGECADTLEQQSRELRRLQQSFDRLAELFGKNSARCLAVTRAAGDALSMPTISLVGGEVLKTRAGDDAPPRLLAPSDSTALVHKVKEANGTLARIKEQEHPILALRIGADGSAAIGVSTKPGQMLLSGTVGVDYIPHSVARSDAIVVARAAAQGNRRQSATRRIARERAVAENSARRMFALEQTATVAALPAPPAQMAITGN